MADRFEWLHGAAHMKWSRVRIVGGWKGKYNGQEGQVIHWDGDKVIIALDDTSQQLRYTPEFATDPCRLPAPAEGEAINKSSWGPTSWTPPRADFQPPQYHDKPGDFCRKCIEVCREIVDDDWWDNIATNEFLDYSIASEQATERAARIEELNQELANAARDVGKIKDLRDRETNKSRKATEALNRERSAHREEIAKYKKQQQADKKELRALKKELRAGKKMLEDDLSAEKWGFSDVVSRGMPFEWAVNHMHMLRCKLRASDHFMEHYSDLQYYQINFLHMCVERQVALDVLTGSGKNLLWYQTIMKG